jgi:hypothetical protein
MRTSKASGKVGGEYSGRPDRLPALLREAAMIRPPGGGLEPEPRSQLSKEILPMSDSFLDDRRRE